MNTICNLFRNHIVLSYFQNKPTSFIKLVYLCKYCLQMLQKSQRIYKGLRHRECLIWAPFCKHCRTNTVRQCFIFFIYAISILGAIHGIQTRSIKNDTLENRIVALEKLVENLEERIKNGTNSSKEGLFVCLMVLNATFNYISAISWRSVLLVEETGGPIENHRPVESH